MRRTTAAAEIGVRHGGHDPQAAPGSAATYLCLGPGFSSLSNTPFRRHKTWVHEGGISTPLVVHWPAGIRARGALRQTPAHVIDIVPTILEIARIEKPAEWDGEAIPPAPGRSLVPALHEDATIDRDLLWWLHEGNRAIRVGDWKLVAARMIRGALRHSAATPNPATWPGSGRRKPNSSQTSGTANSKR